MELKEYQKAVLYRFEQFLSQLAEQRESAEDFVEFQQSKGKKVSLSDYCRETWDHLNQQRVLPFMRDKQGGALVAPYLSRFDGLQQSIPNLCFKVPTGGGKTLLATASVERIQVDYFKRQTGFVLWVVPSDAIYKQTWKQLANREHPYRQMLERASGGRVKVLEKTDAFSRRDVDEQLCVMLLMLPSAARKSKETLRMFRDSGRFTSFFPVEDDSTANAKLLKKVPNLDENDLADLGWADGIMPGSCSIKQSLGNVLQLVRPLIVIDEGHKAYSDTARDTLTGFNPCFMLELSATPNTNGKHQSNVLVNVPGTDLKEEEMIKLPINIINEAKGGWQHTLAVAHEKLQMLQKEAQKLESETGRYIRPIMLVRVERTGKDQRENHFVHAEDAKEYLIEKLGVREEEIRLKTSDKDELGTDDLLSKTSKVRYIITKDALREGWDCPFAYVLTILSKTTANTALTQMIGRVLRQPHACLTHHQILDESYVFTFDQVVSDAVDGVRKGLENEGMADLASSVQAAGTSQASNSKRVTLQRNKKFRDLPAIYLPRVLHRTDTPEEYRLLDYERDILGELNWEEVHYLNAENLTVDEGEKLSRTIAKIDIGKGDYSKGGKLKGQTVIEFEQMVRDRDESETIELSFMARQLLDVVPNPWQGARIIEETLDALRKKSVSDEVIYANRLDILREIKLDLQAQLNVEAESLFKHKLESGEITLRLVASKNKLLNWELADTFDIDVSDSDRVLERKNGEPLERALFEKVYQKEFNELEKNTAWYLDEQECVYWWHRIAVNQQSYSLQGWQRNKVFPDLLACLQDDGNGKFRFAVLETKGEHLKGNDDTEYKRKLFELLTSYADTATKAGQLDLGDESGNVSYTMLLENSWKQELLKNGC